MTAFPLSPTDGQIYSLGTKSWTYSSQGGWLLNKNGPTGPTGTGGPTGPAGSILSSVIVDTFIGDNVTSSFLLSQPPINAYNTIVSIDGLLQTANVNYTLAGQNIIFAEAPISNATIDVIHLLLGTAATGPQGTPGISGPTGPTGPVISIIDNVNTAITTSALSANMGKYLNDTKQKIITYGTAAPTGGDDGDIYIQYV